MLTINDKHIILGSIGGGGGSAPVLPDGWDSRWMLPPTYDETSINGKTDICGLVCNVLDIGDRNYFSCIATGAYTVNVYTGINGTLISTQNVATGIQANWQIDYALCTHQLNTDTRQAWVEIIPQSGQTLTTLLFNTNHPVETNANSSPYIVWAMAKVPYAATVLDMFTGTSGGLVVDIYAPTALVVASMGLLSGIYSLKVSAVLATNYAAVAQQLSALTEFKCDMPAATNCSSMFIYSAGIKNIELTSMGLVSNMAATFGITAEVTCCRSLRKLILQGLKVGFVLQNTAMQAPELNALFTSLGTANGAQTIDIRNNPGSLTCNVSIATAKGYTVLTT